MTLTIIILLSHMLTFAIAMIPVLMVVFYKRLNLGYKYNYQSMLRIAPISITLIIVSAYKVVYIALYSNQSPESFSTNVSLFFSIAFIVCVFLGIYFIIDRGILHFKSKPRRFILNAAAGITILLAIFTIFKLVSQSQQNQLNYLDLAVNMMFPVLTGVLSASGILSLAFYKYTSKSQRIYSIIFVACIPFIILDSIFAQQRHFMLTSIAYIGFIIEVFVEVFSSATSQTKISRESEKNIKQEYDLTDREMEVYKLASKGLSNQEISKRLYVSVHTVKTHLQHIFAKLNVGSKYQLINFDKENKSK